VDDDGISWNSLHEDFNPCFTCQSIINELKFKDLKQDAEDEVDIIDEEWEDVGYGC
jgi:hypothetical protein